MADAKISQLPVATTPLAGTELVPIVQSSTTKQTTVDAVLTAGRPVAASTLSTSGNTTLGDASTDTVQVNGYMGVGGGGTPSAGVFIGSTALTTTGQFGVYSAPTFSSAGTSTVWAFRSSPSTTAASYTVTQAVGYRANDFTKGAGSTITDLHGVYVADQTVGTNNYGITSLVSSGTNKWNIYASGTAANYFAGVLNVGTTTLATGVSAHVSGNLRLASSSGPVLQLEDTDQGDSLLPFWNLQSDAGYFRLLSANRSGTVTTGSITRFSIDAGEAVFNDTGNDYDFRVESDTNTHMLFVDAGNGRVGINESAPDATLSVNGVIQALSPSATTIANGATATVITPNRGFSYINVSRSDTAAFGLLLLVFRTSSTLEIVSTVSDKTSASYSATVSGTALQVTNSSGSEKAFYASAVCIAFGTGD